MAFIIMDNGIVDSWSLISFAKANGIMKVGSFVNSETGEPFKSCVFQRGDDVTFVGFSSNLGELTPKQIAAQKDDLQVVELASGSYKLCKAGQDSWEIVSLGL